MRDLLASEAASLVRLSCPEIYLSLDAQVNESPARFPADLAQLGYPAPLDAISTP